LGDPELLLDHRGDVARRPLTVGEQLDDPPANRVAEDVEREHEANLSKGTYISNR
jgi:hypothetical protein